jgi:hypothetical protein
MLPGFARLQRDKPFLKKMMSEGVIKFIGWFSSGLLPCKLSKGDHGSVVPHIPVHRERFVRTAHHRKIIFS